MYIEFEGDFSEQETRPGFAKSGLARGPLNAISRFVIGAVGFLTRFIGGMVCLLRAPEFRGIVKGPFVIQNEAIVPKSPPPVFLDPINPDAKSSPVLI